MLYGEMPEQKIGDEVLRGFTVRNPNPPKTAIIRLPTADEMIQRLDRQRSIRRSAGPRKMVTEVVPNPKGDLELFNKLRVDLPVAEENEFDEAEARNILQKFLYCETVACEREGDQFRIDLLTPFDKEPTRHFMKIPMQADLMQYRRGILTAIDLPFGQEELRYHSQCAVDLYDQCGSKFDGYACDGDPVPPHHKFSVAAALAAAVDDLDQVIIPN